MNTVTTQKKVFSNQTQGKPTMKTMILNLTLFSLALISPLFAATAHAGAECTVTNNNTYTADQSGQNTGGLDLFIRQQNNGNETGYPVCNDHIKFDVTEVKINQTIEINSVDSSGLTIGNISHDEEGEPESDGEKVTLHSNLAAGEPIFRVAPGVNRIVIGNIRVEGNDSPLIECEDANDLEVSLVDIENAPTTGLKFWRCGNVKIEMVKGIGSKGGTFIEFDGDGVLEDGDDGYGDETNGLTIKDVELTELDGGLGLSVTNAQSVTIEEFKVTASPNAQAAFFDNVKFTKLHLTADNVLSGVELNQVDGTALSDIKITLTGSGNTTYDESGNEVGADGLILNYAALNMTLDDVTVYGFSGNGVSIRDGSNFNTISEATIFSNGGNGILITDVARENKITGGTIYNNIGCGIYLSSENANIVKNVQLPYNGQDCPIGVDETVSPVLVLSDDEVVLGQMYDNKVFLDVDKGFLDDNVPFGKTATDLELHYLTGNSASPRDSDDTSGDTSTAKSAGPKGIRSVGSQKVSASKTSPVASLQADIVSRITANRNSGSSANTGSGKTFISRGTGKSSGRDSVKQKTGGSSVEDSIVAGSPFDINSLPEDDISVTSAQEKFFAVIQNDDGYVLAVWSGSADYASDDNCYTDPDSNITYRIYDADANSDEDELHDWEEDEDMDCQVDDGETDPEDSDSDDDGIDDYQEGIAGYNPLDYDYDNDGLPDGTEDLNGDGIYDIGSGETNARVADTDGDTIIDGDEDVNHDGDKDENETDPRTKNTDGDDEDDNEDACPNLHPSEGTCYYAGCTPGYAPTSDTDDDGDGIPSYMEDENQDCQLGADEMDPSNPDSDGDGIDDGIEYYTTRTDPMKADSDGDCITDGDEDDNGDGVIDLGSDETDPNSSDSDEDGIGDGDEDLDCDGKTDTGETDASKSDSDGDNTGDAQDTCPWTIKSNCSVRYCDVSGYDQDTDGDGLFDKEEDSNGDCAHTVTDKESDPLVADTDGDGLEDDLESCYSTNPNIDDTDGDGRSDYDEVKNSGDICQPMYNLGDSDPLRAEFGNCALNVNSDATSSAALPIMIMTVAGLLWLRRRQACHR